MQVVGRVQAWWGPRADDVLRGSGHMAWPTLLAGVGDDVLQTRLPGLAAVARARDLREAEADLRAAAALTQGIVAWLTEAVGASHAETLVELARLGALALRAGRPDRAAPLLDEAARGLPDGPRKAAVEVRAAEATAALGDVRAARARLARLVDTYPEDVGVRRALAQLQLDAGDAAAAWATVEGMVSADDPALAAVAGLAASRLGDAASAASALRWAVDGFAEGPVRTELRFHLAAALEAIGQREEAWRTIEAAMDGARREPEGPRTPERLASWARMLASRGRAAEVEAALIEAADVARRVLGEISVGVARHLAAVGRFFRAAGRSGEAIGWLEAALSSAGDGDLAGAVRGELAAALRDEAARVASWDASLSASLLAEVQRLAAVAPKAPSRKV